MSALKPKFDTYQDVRNNLAKWSVLFWAACVFVSWQYVLTPEHRQLLATLVPGTLEWVRDAGKFVAALVVGGIISVVLVHWLEIHDHWYDRYIVHWRRRYTRDFMIPALLKPYRNRIPKSGEKLAQEHSKEFMGHLFYDFAGDRHTKISQNFLVRFYERVTKYWISQLAEIAALLLIIASVIYWIFVTTLTKAPLTEAVKWVWGTALVVFLVAKFIGWCLRVPLKESTQAEIDAIHAECSQEFQEALDKFFSNYGHGLKDA